MSSTEEIFANVARVKLCPPPTHFDTAASEVPMRLANSFWDNLTFAPWCPLNIFYNL